jgi:hypothetical protein
MRHAASAVSNAATFISARRTALTRRAVALLARDPPAPIGEVDALLTDACAAALALQARRLNIGRERLAVEREHLRELIAALSARRRAHERGQTSPRRTA